MSNLAWRNLIRGTASVLLAAGLAAPVLADEAGEQGAVDPAQNQSPDSFVLPDAIYDPCQKVHLDQLYQSTVTTDG